MCLLQIAGAAVDWLHMFADSDVSVEAALAGALGCSSLDLNPDDMHFMVGGVPLALQASCMRMVLSLYRSGLYQASSACIRALIGCGSSEAMAIPRPTLDALQSLPLVADMTIDERCHAVGMSSVNAWNRSGFDAFDGHLCHGPPDLFLHSRTLSPRCCEALGSALASGVRVTSLFLDGSTLADAGCSALCVGLASNKTLTNLSVSNCKITFEACRDIRLLLATPGGPPLQTLDISGNSVLDSGIALIGGALLQASLVDSSSTITHNAANGSSDHASVKRASSLPPALSLCVLRASHCSVGQDGAGALCRGVQAASSKGCLHTLVLSSNPLGKGGVGYVSWLLQTHGNRMKHIDIVNCAAIGGCASVLATALDVAADLEASCKVPTLSNGLKEGSDVFFVDGIAYDVHGNVIENAMQSQAEFKLHLDTLRISNSAVFGDDDPEGVGRLLKSLGRIKSIASLFITSSHVSRALQSHAADLFLCPSLRSLTLDYCIISPVAARAVAQGLLKGACLLQYLSVQGCQLGDIGVGHLECVWTQSAGPATLKVSSNGVHDRGAMHLSKIVSSGCVRALYADDNSIGPHGFILISDAMCCQSSRVQTLHINNNNAGAAGAMALFRNLALPQPLPVIDPVVDVEQEFVTSRGTRVKRELADLQREFQDDLDGYSASARRDTLKARQAFADSAAVTATSYGRFTNDAQEYLNGRSDSNADGALRWSWLETVEIRNNNIASGCQECLCSMIRENSTLQVRSVRCMPFMLWFPI